MNIAVPAAYDADPQIFKTELKTYLGTGLIITNIVQGDMFSGTTGVITAGSAPSVDPNAGWYDPGIANGSNRVLELYSGAVLRAVGIPWSYNTWASLPATGDTDERYRVTDTQTLVGFRLAADDEILAGASNGLQGWHPLAGGYALFLNNSGGTINQGEVVKLDVSVSPTRQVSKANSPKSQAVVGVAMHTVLTGSNIIVALLGCQDVIQVKLDPSLTIGGAACAVSKGDAIVVGTSAGTGRSVGLMPTSTVSAPSTIFGIPHGAFAVALKDRAVVDGIGLTPCRLLPAVGQGCTVITNRPVAVSDLTPGTVFTTFFPTKSSTDVGAGDNGAQAATEDLLIQTKNSPVICAGVELEFDGDSATAGVEAMVEFATDGINDNDIIRNKRYGSATHRFIERARIPVLQTGTPGQTSYKWTASAVYGTMTTWKLRLVSYTY